MSKYHKDLSEEQIELMEKLAHHEHARWADWQEYLHSKCRKLEEESGETSLIIPAWQVTRAERQIKTDYKDLSEAEKDSDREQVMRYWKLIK